MKNYKKITGASLIVIASVFLITFTVFGWTGPSQAPPNGNVPAVIDQSSTSQYKAGALGVGGVFETDIGTHLATQSGNVGIGTTSPGAKLDVEAGEIQLSGGYGLDWVNDPWGGSGDDAWIKYIQDGTSEDTELQIGIANDPNDNLAFYQGGSKRMTIVNGNVGIGTTSPDAKLDIEGGNLDMSGNAIKNSKSLGMNVLWDDGHSGRTGIDVCQNRGYAGCNWEIRLDTNPIQLRSCDETWECRNTEGTVANCRLVVCQS